MQPPKKKATRRRFTSEDRYLAAVLFLGTVSEKRPQGMQSKVAKEMGISPRYLRTWMSDPSWAAHLKSAQEEIARKEASTGDGDEANSDASIEGALDDLKVSIRTMARRLRAGSVNMTREEIGKVLPGVVRAIRDLEPDAKDPIEQLAELGEEELLLELGRSERELEIASRFGDSKYTTPPGEEAESDA